MMTTTLSSWAANRPGSLWFGLPRSLVTDIQPSKRTRADTELHAKRAVEVRDITESRVECDIEYTRLFGEQPRGRQAQARAPYVLMRRQAGDAFEYAQEVIWAQPGESRQSAQREVVVQMTIDLADGPRDTSLAFNGVRARPDRTPVASSMLRDASLTANSSQGTPTASSTPTPARATRGDNTSRGGSRETVNSTRRPCAPTSAASRSK
jgi:hypothetical protein